MKLTDVEVGYLKMCLRMKLNKDRKGLIRLSNKFGDAFDLSHPDVESLLVRVETGAITKVVEHGSAFERTLIHPPRLGFQNGKIVFFFFRTMRVWLEGVVTTSPLKGGGGDDLPFTLYIAGVNPTRHR